MPVFLKNAGRPAWPLCAAAVLLACPAVALAAPEGTMLERAAVASARAAQSVLQAAAFAGPRIVAVGERGIVVLSDDAGKTWKQAAVPVSVGLTAVRFADARHGWAVGHGGVVLATSDAGARWTRVFDGMAAARLMLADATAAGDGRAVGEAQRLVQEGADKPFLDVHFSDLNNGFVVGAYNLAFATTDGGRTWRSFSRRLPNPKALHLYSIRVRGDEILITGEQGLVLHSTDRGGQFKALTLPYAGSFFTAELPGVKEIVVAGMRGHVWTSADSGANWVQLSAPIPASFTASAVDAKGRVWLANQAGVLFVQDGRGLTPLGAKLPPLNGLLPLAGDSALALTVAGALVYPPTAGLQK